MDEPGGEKERTEEEEEGGGEREIDDLYRAGKSRDGGYAARGYVAHETLIEESRRKLPRAARRECAYRMHYLSGCVGPDVSAIYADDRAFKSMIKRLSIIKTIRPLTVDLYYVDLRSTVET